MANLLIVVRRRHRPRSLPFGAVFRSKARVRQAFGARYCLERRGGREKVSGVSVSRVTAARGRGRGLGAYPTASAKPHLSGLGILDGDGEEGLVSTVGKKKPPLPH